MSEQTFVDFGQRTAQLAAEHPHAPAAVFVSRDGESALTWHELDAGSNRVAHALAAAGIDARSPVVLLLPTCPEHFVAALAVWKLGGRVLPLNARLPARELDAILALATPAAVVSDRQQMIAWRSDRALPVEPPPSPGRRPGRAIASGGSTGRPKIILDPAPWVRAPGAAGGTLGAAIGMRPRQVQIVAGPLYHTGSFSWSHWGLFDDHTLVVLERFDAQLALDVIASHRVNWGVLVPTMMSRIAALPSCDERAFESLHAFWHAAAPCPPGLKRAWIELVGPTRLYEVYGSTEGAGVTVIDGESWLSRPGSVGRPLASEIRILGEDDSDVAPGEIGEVFMCRRAPIFGELSLEYPAYEYLGHPPAKTKDGFTTVGDMGWLDEDGFLYIADRRSDMIVSGGANVYPAEVEAALAEHGAVEDVVVVGLPDDDLGKRVHAVLQIRRGAPEPAPEELDAFVCERLTRYKVPRSYEFVGRVPRDEAGKVRRARLAEERRTRAFARLW